MKDFILNMDVAIPPDTLKIIITIILLERDDKFIRKITRNNLLDNISMMIRGFGVLHYDSEKFENSYGHYLNLEEKKKKADNLIYEFFPELSNEENTIKFIKSIGD